MKQEKQIRLDLSRLYGFKIVNHPAGQSAQPVLLSAKIGGKDGVKKVA